MKHVFIKDWEIENPYYASRDESLYMDLCPLKNSIIEEYSNPLDDPEFMRWEGMYIYGYFINANDLDTYWYNESFQSSLCNDSKPTVFGYTEVNTEIDRQCYESENTNRGFVQHHNVSDVQEGYANYGDDPDFEVCEIAWQYEYWRSREESQKIYDALKFGI